MAKKKEKEDTSLVVAGSLDLDNFEGYGEDEGGGFEHQTQADIKVPFMVLLQGLSPVVVDNEGDENSPYRPGKWYNTVTGDVYDRDKGFLFVPSTTRHQFAEWTPRDQGSADGGGGFHGHYSIDDPIVKQAIASAEKFGQNKHPENGNLLVETFYLHGVVVDEETGSIVGPASMYFKKTHIRSYKTWNSRMSMFRLPKKGGGQSAPPLYAHLIRVTSKQEKNDQGTFYVPVLNSANPAGIKESLLAPSDDRFLAAKMLKEQFDKGDASVDPNQAAQKEGDAADSSGTPF